MLKPDVVVAWRDLGISRTVITLDRLGVPTERVDASSLADVRRMILCVGDLLGARTRADSLVRAIDDSLAALRAQADRRALRSVIYIVWDHPLIVAGGGSFLDSLITFAGGANVFGDTRSEWPTVNFEEVVKRDPDVIIVPSSIGSEAIKRLKFDRRWRALRAARSGRIVVVNGELVSRPGPRVAVAARAIAVALKSVGERP
jgi:iron complex transport system substrate-binding protein